MKKVKHILIILGILLFCILLRVALGGGDTCPMERATEEKIANLNVQDSAYHKIDAEKAKEMIDKGNITIVDVRTAEEYAEKHIPGAVLLPNESIGEEPPAELPDKDVVLLVHCRTGVRSKEASDKLVALGYTKVYDFGGITDWPYETESEEK